jgi:hypothetical protein
MAHYYILPDGERVATMKAARTILGIGSHKFRKLVKDEIVIKVDGKLNETLIAHGDEKQDNL